MIKLIIILSVALIVALAWAALEHAWRKVSDRRRRSIFERYTLSHKTTVAVVRVAGLRRDVDEHSLRRFEDLWMASAADGQEPEVLWAKLREAVLKSFPELAGK